MSKSLFILAISEAQLESLADRTGPLKVRQDRLPCQTNSAGLSRILPLRHFAGWALGSGAKQGATPALSGGTPACSVPEWRGTNGGASVMLFFVG